MGILSTILAPFVALGVALGSLFVPQEVNLGASEPIPVVVAFFETTLASAITTTATSFTLTSATDKDGNTLASSTYAFVIDEGSSNEEIVIADCTGTACTNAMRGVSVLTGNTEVTALKKSHRRGASIKITDAPILMLVSRILRGEAIVNYTPDTDFDLVTKKYVDDLALGITTIPATLVDDGIVELATGVQAASSTATDNSGSPLALHTGISTSTAPASGSYVVVSETDGNIANGFIDETYFLTVASSSVVYEYDTATTTSWAKPSVGNMAFVELWGGGGSGTSILDGSITYAPAGAGGGGGKYVSFTVPLNILSATTSIVVGAGGNAVTSLAGVAGSSTKFSTFAEAGGGLGGDAGTADLNPSNGGAGATNGSSTILQVLTDNGAAGATVDCNPLSIPDGGSNDYGGAGGGAGCYYSSGPTDVSSAGGTSTFGGNGGAGAINGPGVAGSSKGGGGGASVNYGAQGYPSGKGGDGYIRITVF